MSLAGQDADSIPLVLSSGAKMLFESANTAVLKIQHRPSVAAQSAKPNEASFRRRRIRAAGRKQNADRG
jgi:hypothetical protein